MPLVDWLGVHEALKGSHVNTSEYGLWAEFRTIAALGIDVDIYFSKDRYTRQFLTGGVIAQGALTAMQQFDDHKEAEAKAKKKK